MKKLILFLTILVASFSSYAQYDYDELGYNGPERYFYDEDFDWRWDVRVRISDGIRNGLLTRREANRLYNRLESIERREFAYQSDGNYSAWEQDEIWEDVVWLNRRLGLELRDGDRRYYGYSLPGLAFRGHLPYYFGNRYDFYRFDQRGFGSLSLGYSPRFYYPRHHYYYNPNRYGSNWRNQNDRNDRRMYDSRGRSNNNWDGPRDSNRNSDRYNNNSGRNQDTRPNRSNEKNRSEVRPQRDSDRGSSNSRSKENNGSWNRSDNDRNGQILTPRGQKSETESRGSSGSRSRENKGSTQRSNDRSYGEILTPRGQKSGSETRSSQSEGRSSRKAPERTDNNGNSRGRNVN